MKVIILPMLSACFLAAGSFAFAQDIGDVIVNQKTSESGPLEEVAVSPGDTPPVVIGFRTDGSFGRIELGNGLAFAGDLLTAPAQPTSWGSIGGTLSSQTDLQAALVLRAPLASPTFTGTVTIPTGASIAGYLTTASASSTYDQARRNADNVIESMGPTASKNDKEAAERREFDIISKQSGIELDPTKNDRDALNKIKASRIKAEEEVEKIRLDNAAKQRALAIEETSDADTTERENRRAAAETERRAKAAEDRALKQSEKEAADAEKAAENNRAAVEKERGETGPQYDPYGAPDEAMEEPAAPEVVNALRQLSQATNNSGIKSEIDQLLRELSNGGNAAEMERVIAFIREHGQQGNAMVKQLADSLANFVSANRDALTSLGNRQKDMEKQLQWLRSFVKGA